MELSDDFKVDAGITELEAKIGVREHFFRNLLQEDDWSFIIKLHALFEAACTHLLLFHFKEPDLTAIFSRLELSNKTFGKLAFLAKLDLLGKNDRRLISTLSELRNSLVHDVRNTEFYLTEMIANLTSPELKQFAISFSPFESVIREILNNPKAKPDIDQKLQNASSLEAIIERAKSSPKLHIWLGAYHTLVSIVDMYGYSDYKQWMKAKTIFDDEDE